MHWPRLGVMFVLVLTGPVAVRVADGQGWMEDSGPMWRPTLMHWSCGANSEGGAPLDEPLQTDRPDFTEASTTVGRRVAQVEMGYTYIEDNQDGERLQSHNYPELLLRYGLLADWLEFRLGWVYANEVLTNDTLRTSIDGSRDLYVGAKIALTPQAGIFPEMAITPQALVPAGAEEFSSGETLPGLNWLYSWDVTEAFSIGASTQVNRRLDEETDEPFLEYAQSIALGRSLTENIGMYGEWFVWVPDGSDSATTQHYLNGGVTLVLGLNIQLDARVGCGLSENSQDFFAGTGAAVRF